MTTICADENKMYNNRLKAELAKEYLAKLKSATGKSAAVKAAAGKAAAKKVAASKGAPARSTSPRGAAAKTTESEGFRFDTQRRQKVQRRPLGELPTDQP